MSANILPIVSVIIPTKNSSQTLDLCLSSVQGQTYKNIEIIVVDNFSTDETKNIAQRYTKNVYEYGPERTYQKNYAIEQSHGEYVCFIDSDMELTDTVIEACLALLSENDDAGGVCIPEDSVGRGFFVAVRAFERSFYGDTHIESARFFSKKDVLAVGCFETDIVFFEESLLPQKIESKLHKSTSHRANTLIHHHEGSTSLLQWLKKKYYYGQSLKEYEKKVELIGIPKVSINQMSIIGRYMIFLRSKRFFTKPLLALGVLFLKTAEFSAGALGFIVSTSRNKLNQ